MEMSWQTIKSILKEVLQEEMGMGRYEMAPKYVGGKLIIQPFDTSLKNKEIPADVFFKKITAIREKMRVLEQKINNNPRLTAEDKAEMQLYITRAYGSLTTFNVLFKHEEDRFEGVKGEE